MSLPAVVKSIYIENDRVASSSPAFYTAAAHTIFSVTGGPVWIKAMVEYLDTAMTNATTTTITVCGVACDAGAVAINAGAIGSVVVSPLAVFAKTASALAQVFPNVAAITGESGRGMIAGLGDIVVTFATVMAAADRYSLHIVYQKLSPASLIS